MVSVLILIECAVCQYVFPQHGHSYSKLPDEWKELLSSLVETVRTAGWAMHIDGFLCPECEAAGVCRCRRCSSDYTCDCPF